MLLAAVYKSLQRLWSDTYIAELLGFRNKSMLAGNLNAEHPVWNSFLYGVTGVPWCFQAQILMFSFVGIL
jgi:hypothetical protein